MAKSLEEQMEVLKELTPELVLEVAERQALRAGALKAELISEREKRRALMDAAFSVHVYADTEHAKEVMDSTDLHELASALRNLADVMGIRRGE
jgi:hypothetical protein